MGYCNVSVTKTAVGVWRVSRCTFPRVSRVGRVTVQGVADTSLYQGKLTWYWGGRSLFALLLSLVIIPHVNPADLCCHRTIISVSTGYLVLWRAVVLCLLGDGWVLSVGVGAGGEAAGAHLNTIAQAAMLQGRRVLAKLFWKWQFDIRQVVTTPCFPCLHKTDCSPPCFLSIHTKVSHVMFTSRVSAGVCRMPPISSSLS